MPEAAKPNRRRGVIVTTVFALVLAGIIYYLWTNHAYLKWRFIGGEVDLMDDCLATGYLSLDQVVTLMNSGATPKIRIAALGLMVWKFKIPCDDHLAKAIRTFAAKLPDDEWQQPQGAHSIAMIIGRSSRPDLVDVLVRLAGHENVHVRTSVQAAFFVDTDYGDTDLGDEGWGLIKKLMADPSPVVRGRTLHCLTGERAPQWAASAVLASLSDPDAEVRRWAIVSARTLLRKDKGTKQFPARIRHMLDSPTEDEVVRARALSILYDRKLIDDDKLADFVNDPQEQVAEKAKRLIKERDEEREETRKKSSPNN